MKDPILPEELLSISLENHFQKYSKTGQRIYLIVLIVMIFCISSLFLIKLELVVQSEGMIRPVIEKIELRAMTQGKVLTVNIAEDQKVSRGDLLIKLDSRELENRINSKYERLAEHEELSADLKELLSTLENGHDPVLNSQRIKSEYLNYKQEHHLLNSNYVLHTKELARSRLLFNKEMISKREMERAQFDCDLMRLRIGSLIQQKKLQWMDLQEKVNTEIESILSTLSSLKEALGRHEVYSPSDGSIQDVKVVPGGFVESGELFASLSPDTFLIAEVYVRPDQVAMIRVGQQVKMRFHTFDPHQWGMLSGNVESISDDAFMLDGRALFRVFCSLSTDHLQLVNGRQGFLKKGMTLDAFFPMKRRKLIQLLFDQLDDWLPESDKYPVNV